MTDHTITIMPAGREPRTPGATRAPTRLGLLLALVAAVGVLTVLVLGRASAATAGPGFRLDSYALPSKFNPQANGGCTPAITRRGGVGVGCV